MSRSQRDKGARGEREADQLLRSLGFRPGKAEGHCERAWHGPDLQALHVEVKRQERCRPVEWYRQARRDAAEGKIPLVLHRGNNERWKVTLSAEDFFTVFRRSDLL